MNKKALNTAVLAGIAGVAGIANIASAVNLNPDGVGEVLLYPYFTVNGGNDTLLSVVNTTDRVKAVKVRFMESKNTAEVLDFNLYLSPFDVWTGAITSVDADGAALLLTGDTSCTVPAIPGGGVAFRNFQYAGDGGGDGLDRTREGHIEIIEMGEVSELRFDAAGLPVLGTNGVQLPGLGANAVHDATSIPADCPALDAAWAPNAAALWTNDPQLDMSEPLGGLFGGAAIVNANGGYMGGYTADAISAFYNPGAGLPVSLHTGPGSLFPSLNSAATGAAGAPVDSLVFDNGVLISTSFTSPVDAVSSVLMREAIFNDYAIDDALDAATEWVITFPTKRFYVNNGVDANGVPNPADRPFTSPFGPESAAGAGDATANEPISIGIWDREEQIPGTVPGETDFSPLPPGVVVTGPQLPFETNVLSFSPAGEVDPGASVILASPNARNIDPTQIDAGTQNGWARVGFEDADHVLVSNSGLAYLGLPVTGFAMQIYRNNTLVVDGASVLSNYGGIFAHRSSRATSLATAP